jgi:glycosyltransferase involved in cell wall biosynthesis
VIYDAHEDVPATIDYKYYIPRFLRPLVARVIDRAEKSAARKLSAVVVATPAIGRRFASIAGQVVLVQNFPRMEDLPDADGIPYRLRPPSVAYVGVLSESRGTLQMIRAMGLLAGSLGASLHIAGAFSPPSLRIQAEQESGWDLVCDHGVMSQTGVARLLRSCMAGLVLLHPERNYVEAYSTKMFEYMGAGLPVIASDFPLWRQIVTEAGCGLLVDPRDPHQIAMAITYLLENRAEAQAMGERGRQAVRDRFNWGTQASRLIELYESLETATPHSKVAFAVPVQPIQDHV